jgi:predicted house-cleaning NTP pyrophosphatase (Maf/HAM1 superfamily)
MHSFDNTEIQNYVDKAWPSISDSCGGYYFEKTPHLFSAVRGNWFDILGLSIRPMLSFLNQTSERKALTVPPIVAVLGHPISHSK